MRKISELPNLSDSTRIRARNKQFDILLGYIEQRFAYVLTLDKCKAKLKSTEARSPYQIIKTLLDAKSLQGIFGAIKLTRTEIKSLWENFRGEKSKKLGERPQARRSARFLLLRANLEKTPDMKYDPVGVELEHIRPQSPAADSDWVESEDGHKGESFWEKGDVEKWLNSWGNVALLHSDQNKEVSNLSWKIKARSYVYDRKGQPSAFQITWQLSRFRETFAVDECKQNYEDITTLFCDIFGLDPDTGSLVRKECSGDLEELDDKAIGEELEALEGEEEQKREDERNEQLAKGILYANLPLGQGLYVCSTRTPELICEEDDDRDDDDGDDDCEVGSSENSQGGHEIDSGHENGSSTPMMKKEQPQKMRPKSKDI